MRYQVTTPTPGLTGQHAGVTFVDGTATVASDHPGARRALAYFRQAGYGVQELGEQAASTGSTPAGEPDAELFDPAEHDVASVLAHLAEADLAEATRVLDVEAAGKARKTVLEQRSDILARAAAKEEGTPQS